MTPPTPDPLVEYLLDWIREECDFAQNKIRKFSREENDRQLQAGGYGPGSFWDDCLNTYLYRSQVLGLANPNGRQALAKFVSTAVALLESTVRVYGPLPEPGLPSGHGLDQLKPLPHGVSNVDL